MGSSNLTLASLIGSRICHDLISPIGAIGNGLELIGMSGAGGGMEMDLIARSAEQTRARIAFYRLAFGLSGGEDVTRREMAAIFDDLLAGGRLSCTWAIEGPAPRWGVRLACLAFMAGLLMKLFLREFQKHPAYPIRDPRLLEALGHRHPVASPISGGELSETDELGERVGGIAGPHPEAQGGVK